ncbi:iron permease FTR1 [Daedalea quercina L-15889]|uniref:Iron permease FTR1 n=1 Tax=Daedalea quercina L-15889 TaxID=1314783 RepID=A0A165PN36_9APHY|nr:iron permease FTR1 [Daedalea quercina L-15889]
MAKNLFSVSIFFIVFRETIEAAIIVSVLLGLVEQIVYEDPARLARLKDADRTSDPESPESPTTEKPSEKDPSASSDASSTPELTSGTDDDVTTKRLLRKMRFQIFMGAILGLAIAGGIGAAFIAVWFTQAADLWANTENLWEGIFSLIASIIIFVMGVTMLKMDRAKAKWRVKLQRAFSGQEVDRNAKAGKWVLFILPMITVLREGMEAIVFVGGVSLGQQATSIPIAAIVGLICGLVVGFLIYTFASRTTLTIFMIVMTNFILLIGSGLFSKAVWYFESHMFSVLVGAEVDDTGGDGPGSFDVRGSVWHINCCNPENNFDNTGWSIFAAIFGWTNSATLGSVLSYVFYWIAVMVVLVYLKFKEGRTKLLGRESQAGVRRRERKEMLAAQAAAEEEEEKQREREAAPVVEELVQ